MHEDGKKNQQDDINHALSVVVSKHNNDIMIIKEEVKILKDVIRAMQKKLHLKKINGKSNLMR